MGFESVREGQLTEDKLKMGYWWVTHKVQVRRVFTLVLLLIDLALVGFAGFGFLDWYFGSGVRERGQIAQMTKQYSNYASLREMFAPVNLMIDSSAVLNSGEDTYDILARVTNPNMRHWVEFDYQFGSESAAVMHDFILPGSAKYIHQLGVKSASRPGSPELLLSNIAWHRLNAHVIRPDFASWAGTRLKLQVSDTVFTPPAPTDPLIVSRVSFNIKNDTGFGYRRVGFFVNLIGGAGLVGVNYVTISNLRPGEKRPVDASWFSVLPSVSSVEVIPDVNIFDNLVYIPPGE